MGEREEFEAFLKDWTGRNMEYHALHGTTGLEFAWQCWLLRGGIERERASAAHLSELAKLRAALELVAVPQRNDGTWNRDREACRQLAEEALRDSPRAVWALHEKP